MNQSKEDIALGRFLSLVLRHRPSAAGISLDDQGWADVQQLLAGCNRTGKRIDRETLERIVKENGKQRYRFNDDRTRIRANQGHSVEVDVELRESAPPEALYHGTASRNLESILGEGITRGSRLYVHLAKDAETAVQVGRRHGSPIVLQVDASAMVRDGHRFYVSDNGVWLCDCVPPEYVRALPDLRD